MSSAHEREADDLDDLDELDVERVLYSPAYSGGRRSKAAHRPDADDAGRPACGHGGDGELILASPEEARRHGINRACRHTACFGEAYSGRREVVVCSLCGTEDVDYRAHLPKCERRHEVP